MLVSVRRIVNKLTFGFCAAHINIRKSCGKAFVMPYEVIIRYLELFAYYNYFEFFAVKEVVRRKYFVAVNSAVRKIFGCEFFDSRHRDVLKVFATPEHVALESLYAFGEYDFRYYAVIDESRIFNERYRLSVIFAQYVNFFVVSRIICYIIYAFVCIFKVLNTYRLQFVAVYAPSVRIYVSVSVAHLSRTCRQSVSVIERCSASVYRFADFDNLSRKISFRVYFSNERIILIGGLYLYGKFLRAEPVVTFKPEHFFGIVFARIKYRLVRNVIEIVYRIRIDCRLF